VPSTRASTIAALALVLTVDLSNLAAVTADLRDGDRTLGRLLDHVPGPPVGARSLPLLFHSYRKDVVLLLDHATEWLCLLPGVVDWENYEARGFCFPVRFRGGVKRPNIEALRRGDPTGAGLDVTDFVYVGPQCPPPLRSRVAATFPVITRCGSITVYSRAPLTKAP
jgi:hypothetical protein